MKFTPIPTTFSRREFLMKSGLGFGTVGLSTLLDEESRGEGRRPAGDSDVKARWPLEPKAPHFRAKARSVIFIFLQGGPSHLDTFDPKPVLSRLDGQPLPASFDTSGLNLQFIKASETKLMASPFLFKKWGRSGLEISSLFGNLGRFADDLAIIRSCYHDTFVHGPALNLLYTGSVIVGNPSVGAWVLYGLGCESGNLPAYIVMTDGSFGARLIKNAYGAGFLPAIYQGTVVRIQGNPIANLSPPDQWNQNEQRVMLDQLNVWNWRHAEPRQDDSRLTARLANYELAFRMQMAAPELMDISNEPEGIRKLYGLDQELTARFGRMCLLARRMVERGVRFVQLTSTDWDGHADCEQNHLKNAEGIDKPIAGLFEDLKQRGVFESTLIICTGEFGRTPVMQGKQGRDHNPYGFSTWMAGGGVQGGKPIGATDELGFRAVEDKVHVHDLHATTLSLLGLDHKKLTFFFHGLDKRLTGVGDDGSNNLTDRLTRA